MRSADATGRRPAGFRGPGFSWSPTLLEMLFEQGYDYDASTLPSYLGPIARAFYFGSAGKLSAEEREQRKDLFGHFSDGLRPVRPFYWQLSGGRQLLEIPVTTIPVFKTPFHFSYLAFLARYSEQLMFTYLRVALGMCRLTGTEPSFLLHPLDLIGGDKAPQLAFFPGMDILKRQEGGTARQGAGDDRPPLRHGADGGACGGVFRAGGDGDAGGGVNPADLPDQSFAGETSDARHLGTHDESRRQSLEVEVSADILENGHEHKRGNKKGEVVVGAIKRLYLQPRCTGALEHLPDLPHRTLVKIGRITGHLDRVRPQRRN